MLTLEKLNQYYGSSHTLKDLSLTIRPGACTVIMGRNGVGKTTLMQCITGLLPLKSGSIHLSGEDITSVPAEGRAAIGIGYVPQGRQIFPLLSVEENLRIGLRARRDGLKSIPDLHLRPVSGPQGDAASTRRGPVGWAATTARHRQSTGYTARTPVVG